MAVVARMVLVVSGALLLAAADAWKWKSLFDDSDADSVVTVAADGRGVYPVFRTFRSARLGSVPEGAPARPRWSPRGATRPKLPQAQARPAPSAYIYIMLRDAVRSACSQLSSPTHHGGVLCKTNRPISTAQCAAPLTYLMETPPLAAGMSEER
ncbi:Coagulation factor XII [Frankliniella fusca]|uniref:Coagulation factor XII n=1 Tax=Frankliniella fusca TaxID=407009 RepID=A0AAE1H4V5_9NEOP|nr:Coagulation factor XII [Frankliniella fusca]